MEGRVASRTSRILCRNGLYLDHALLRQDPLNSDDVQFPHVGSLALQGAPCSAAKERDDLLVDTVRGAMRGFFDEEDSSVGCLP